jgi:hypothetical protein
MRNYDLKKDSVAWSEGVSVSVPASQVMYYMSMTKINWLMFREITAVCWESE